MKNIIDREYKSIKIPAALHKILRWMSLNKNKYMYEIIAKWAYDEMNGNK